MRRKTLVLVILSFVVQIHSQDNGNATSYNSEESLSNIFNYNITTRQIKFEDSFESQIDVDSQPYQPITFDDQNGGNSPFKFDHEPIRNVVEDLDDTQQANDPSFTFQDNNQIEEPIPVNKKRRKKPRYPTSINASFEELYVQYLNVPHKYPSTNNPLPQPITFDGPNTFKFKDDPVINNENIPQTNSQGLTFQDANKVEETKPPKKKRRRRRRKPRYQNGYQGLPNQNQGLPSQYPYIPQEYPSPYPGNFPQGYSEQGYPGYTGNQQGYPGQSTGNPQGIPGTGQYPYPTGGVGQYYRPPRRPKQSLASEALTAVTGALTSIAQYDDYQCVPRLLCEAAGGGALGNSSVLQNIVGLQPLLTLLSAYNGISSSPLFIFGRAVFLGMTAKGNLGSCRYAYPECPNDPEQLVHYLNNYNGGFFRFFNAPQLNNPQFGQQNVEQFYNQLSQNYGLYQPGSSQLANQQNYGIYQPNTPYEQSNGIYQPIIPNQQYNGIYASNIPNQQHNGIYQPNIPNQQNNGIYQQNFPNQQNYGIYQPNIPPINSNNQANTPGFGYAGANLYDHRPQIYGHQSYGPTYPYGLNRFKSNNNDNKIEKRIINKPLDDVSIDSDDNDNPKWLFSESSDNNKDIY